jgi:hypothetical protein
MATTAQRPRERERSAEGQGMRGCLVWQGSFVRVMDGPTNTSTDDHSLLAEKSFLRKRFSFTVIYIYFFSLFPKANNSFIFFIS